MEIAPKPENETERLRMVRSLGLLDTPPEERFDRYTRFARQLFGVPIAYVSIMGEDKQWFKSAQGLDLKETTRDVSFCSHTILEDKLMVVEDLLQDTRFEGSPFIVEEPYLRFYAGVKLHVADGFCIGTLCIADTKPRYPSDEELNLLKELAELLEDEFKTHAQSTTDVLTGLSNHRGFNAIGRHSVALCRRTEKPATLMTLQIENFPEMNAEHGRETGDKVLKDVGQLLLNEFRDSDVLARTGASNFSVLLTGTNAQGMKKPLENIAKAFHEENMNLPFDITYKVESIGYDAAQFADVDAFLNHLTV